MTRLDSGFVKDLHWSPNGRRLALFYPHSGSTGEVLIAPSWKHYSSISGGPVSAATWSPRGTRLLLVEYPDEVGLPPLIGLVLPKRGSHLFARVGFASPAAGSAAARLDPTGAIPTRSCSAAAPTCHSFSRTTMRRLHSRARPPPPPRGRRLSRLLPRLQRDVRDGMATFTA